MRSTKLSAHNIMWRDIEVDLALVTVIAGNNYTGKTTHLNALALALYGYVPGVAKKPNEVFDLLATDNPLQVAATDDQGRLFGRQWAKRAGSVSCTVSPMAKSIEFPAVMLNAQEYF